MTCFFAPPDTRLLTILLLGSVLTACGPGEAAGPVNFAGDERRGAELIGQYGCGGCHDIPGIAGADGNVGPPLHRIGTRTYIAGFVRNSPENMTFWIREPQKVLPGNAMPSMGIPQKDAQDITAYLYSLK
jgi:cytochrome c